MNSAIRLLVFISLINLIAFYTACSSDDDDDSADPSKSADDTSGDTGDDDTLNDDTASDDTFVDDDDSGDDSFTDDTMDDTSDDSEAASCDWNAFNQCRNIAHDLYESIIADLVCGPPIYCGAFICYAQVAEFYRQLVVGCSVLFCPTKTQQLQCEKQCIADTGACLDADDCSSFVSCFQQEVYCVLQCAI